MKHTLPILFALGTALAWGTYGPVLGNARSPEKLWSPFKPYVGIGLAYMNGDAVEANDAEANRWLLRAAEGGHRTGQLLLAARAREGAGFDAPDLELAFRWFERAARQGDATARYMTAYSYARGEGVERDQAQAFAWAELSSESGQQDSFAVRKNLRSSMSKEERRRGLELMKSLREPVLEEQKWKMHTIPRSGS